MREMKKAIVIGMIAAMTVGMTACGNSSSDSAPATTAPAATENTQQEKTADTAASDLSGTVVITGSTSVEKILNDMKDEFTAQNPNVTVEYTGSGSSAGIKDTKAKTNNIGASSREIKDDEKDADLKQEVFAYDGIAVIVNPANEAVKNITTEQLADIMPVRSQSGKRLAVMMQRSLWCPVRRAPEPEALLKS